MTAPVGVALVGHGRSATALLEAARGIVGDAPLSGILALDAGQGENEDHDLSDEMCAAIEQADQGTGVVVLVDLLGASPCQCAQREGQGHGVVVVSGLNLAMVLKCASLDRGAMTPQEISAACSDSGRRAVAVRQAPREPEDQEVTP